MQPAKEWFMFILAIRKVKLGRGLVVVVCGCVMGGKKKHTWNVLSGFSSVQMKNIQLKLI